jgi:hypothetical protein
MLKFGMNTFRVPFRLEYVYELWEGTWLADNLDIPEYLPPSPLYLQVVLLPSALYLQARAYCSLLLQHVCSRLYLHDLVRLCTCTISLDVVLARSR